MSFLGFTGKQWIYLIVFLLIGLMLGVKVSLTNERLSCQTDCNNFLVDNCINYATINNSVDWVNLEVNSKGKLNIDI